VYIYSHDSDSAYEPADTFVLARVVKDALRDRAAYEFFEQLDGNANPVWTPDIDRRGPVFAHSRRCYRSGISYNAALGRYLWCQTLPASADSRGPRFQGGFGIYDAPEPWGPWTTAFLTEAWDVGPGETSSIPTKWISHDGKTIHLVFSGDDCFSVRKGTLNTDGGSPEDAATAERDALSIGARAARSVPGSAGRDGVRSRLGTSLDVEGVHDDLARRVFRIGPVPRKLLVIDQPKWRNRQTRRTQNPVRITPGVGSSPTFGIWQR
jgi:hypothetical protein